MAISTPKITVSQALALTAGKPDHTPVTYAGNTTVERVTENGVTTLKFRLHGHRIAEVRLDPGKLAGLFLFSAGYHTRTTAARLDGILNANVPSCRIALRRGVLTLIDTEDGQDMPMREGASFVPVEGDDLLRASA